ncbi:MAG: conjugal transfer protein TraX [Lachnospiraceae bacterium]|nr:conjugal transfer protein TraX [Lachnospiraceae bacterium]
MSVYVLKMIAIICMLIDHMGAIFINPNQNASAYLDSRMIGRLAFPIFCFMIVEGYSHTKNVANYFMRLVCFGLISEIPFDLAFSDRGLTIKRAAFDWGHQNVFFTLAIGLLTIHVINWVCSEKFISETTNFWGKAGYAFVVIFVTTVLGYLADRLGTDYGHRGVWLISMLYVFKKNRYWQAIAGAVTVFITTFMKVYDVYIYRICKLETNGFRGLVTNISRTLLDAGSYYKKTYPNWHLTSRQSSSFMWMQMFALISFIIILFYNGEPGRKKKYFFYVFYPAHLMVLFVLKLIAG